MSAISSRIQLATRKVALVQMKTTSGEHGQVSLMRISLTHSDFNFVRQDGECVAVGPEPVPAGTCIRKDDTYMGSSGYRKIPGNTCDRDAGVKKDEPVQRPCTKGELSLMCL